ncbi:MAG: hypothetical protein JW860_10190 [Sedimentisphaerales bacterium]|nr:hypothetical protein [Sedimentisphaerales bacterium]
MVTRYNMKIKSCRRGSALLLAMVLTIILFIMGMSFVSTTQVERTIVSGVQERTSVDIGVEAIIAQIDRVLVEDLTGIYGDKEMILDADLENPDTNEYWDYPCHRLDPGTDLVWGTADDEYNNAITGTLDDPWLACLEPRMIDMDEDGMFNDDNVYGFAHITDLYVSNPSSSLANAFAQEIEDRDGDRVSFRNLRATIIDPDEPIFNESGGDKADADGDGVADSRWVVVPDITGPQGQTIYTAVRIIDNCAMINLNTAYRNPEDPDFGATSGSPQWDGTQLSHINLIDIMSKSGPLPERKTRFARLQDARLGFWKDKTIKRYYKGNLDFVDTDTYENDTKYESDVALRLLNPAIVTGGKIDIYFAPFDIQDELELRNRFFLSTSTRPSARCLFVWPETLYPGAPTGVFYPYDKGRNSKEYEANLENWYIKAASAWSSSNQGLGNYNKRHLVTTYSFDRAILPKSDTSAMPGSLQSAWEGSPSSWTYWNPANPRPGMRSFRSISINDMVDTSSVKNTHFDPPTTEQLAAAIYLGLPKSSVIKTKLPQFSDVGGGPTARRRLAGILAVNLKDYFDSDSKPTRLEVGVGATTTSKETFYGYESNGGNLYIGMIGIAQDSDDADPPNPNRRDLLIEIYNPGPGLAKLGDWELEIGPAASIGSNPSFPLSGYVPAGSSYFVTGRIVGEEEDPLYPSADATFTIELNPSDSIVLSNTSSGEKCHIDVIEDIGSFPLFTADRIEGYEKIRGVNYFSAGNNCDFPIWPKPDYGSWNWVLQTTPQGVAFKGRASVLTTATINIPVADNNMKNVGEIYNVLAVGMVEVSRGSGREFITMPEMWESIRTASEPEMKLTAAANITAGRLDPGDADFGNLLRYFTTFTPFNDGIDNDGNGKSDNPAKDEVDNDEDGDIDAADPDETDPKSEFLEKNELAVAGRININTAPWYVIAQLPWMADPIAKEKDMYKLAQAVVGYRDRLPVIPKIVDYSRVYDYSKWQEKPDATDSDEVDRNKTRKYGMGLGNSSSNNDVREDPGFANIGELVNVTHASGGTGTSSKQMDWYDIRRWGKNVDSSDVPINDNAIGSGNPGPFYNTDTVANDLWERDIFFQRVSNLATVRSDTFTAYILVRVGMSGPQKRMIAIFDRTNVFSSADKPKLVALNPVPDPR